MSTSTSPVPGPTAGAPAGPSGGSAALDLAGARPVPFGRLARVELRKSVDTRAGRWFAIAIIGVVVAVEVIYALAAPDEGKNFSDFLGVAGGVLGYFLPILTIMLVTSEAGQRTGLVTFTLEPRRSRVVAAKFAAGVLLSVGVLVVAALIAVAVTLLAVATGAEVTWSVRFAVVLNGFVITNLVGVLVGFAIAMLLMNTPAAIVGYFVYSLVLPAAILVLASLSSGFLDVAPWLHPSLAFQPLFTGDNIPAGVEWARIAVALVIWLVLPLTLGVRRLLRLEFK